MKLRLALLALTTVAATACRQDMHDQAKLEPYEASRFFSDGQGSRHPVPGTVARGQLRDDPHLDLGLGPDGEFAREYPVAVTAEVIARGRERYEIFCSPCHGGLGDGRGMIVRRGFKAPGSFHTDRLRATAPGYYFDVISNGFGQMSSYAAQIGTHDRWAVAAYIRALQLSQYAAVGELADGDRAALEAAAPEAAAPEAAALEAAALEAAALEAAALEAAALEAAAPGSGGHE